MRLPVLVFLCAASMLGGCAGAPPTSRPVLVVEVTSDFIRTLANGSVWTPPRPDPYSHGCGDGFYLDRETRRVVLYESDGQGRGGFPSRDPDIAVAAVSVQHRNPGAYERDAALLLPRSLPYATRLEAANGPAIEV